METTKITLDKTEARDLWREYKEHRHYSQPIDREIQAVYARLAQGRTVIRAIASIAAAGLNEAGLPKLAIIRADADRCYFHGRSDGSAFFHMDWQARGHTTRRRVDLPRGSFVFTQGWPRAEARPPLIPIHLRPKTALSNYHILWEAIWEPLPPGDPLLLRRFGKSDMWLVCAAWDLTEVEKAALATRMND